MTLLYALDIIITPKKERASLLPLKSRARFSALSDFAGYDYYYARYLFFIAIFCCCTLSSYFSSPLVTPFITSLFGWHYRSFSSSGAGFIGFQTWYARGRRRLDCVDFRFHYYGWWCHYRLLPITTGAFSVCFLLKLHFCSLFDFRLLLLISRRAFKPSCRQLHMLS